MRGNRTTLKDVDDGDKDRDFYFDFSFWSFDGFSTLPNGMVSNLINKRNYLL